MDRCRRDMERQVAMGNRNVGLLLGGGGGDFNASIGRGGERRGVCGKYGLGRGNGLLLGGKGIVIGGDFNASIGRGGERRGVCGKYGLSRGNEAGRD